MAIKQCTECLEMVHADDLFDGVCSECRRHFSDEAEWLDELKRMEQENGETDADKD